MQEITRRSAVLGPLAVPFVWSPARAAARIRFTLDWKYQGVHAWFYVARDKGYFRDEGIEIVIDQGEGSAATIARIMSGTYDAGFGDINSVIAAAAQKPDQAPRLVYEMYNRGPYVIVTKADGPIKSLKDIEGRSLGAPAGSSTARLMPVLARRNQIDMSRVNSMNVAANLQEQMLAGGGVDGILGFNYSIYTNLPVVRLDPQRDVRWFSFADYGLDLYSNGVMVSPALAKQNPDAVRGLVRAINRGFKDTVADPDGAIAAMLAVEPLLNGPLEKRRLEYTLRNVMFTAWTQAEGFGGMDPQKLTRSVQAVVEGYGLPRTPANDEIYDAGFLPPVAERNIHFPGG